MHSRIPTLAHPPNPKTKKKLNHIPTPFLYAPALSAKHKRPTLNQPKRLSTMSVIRADDLRNLTNNVLRERLRDQFQCHVGSNVNKTQLVGRLLIAHAEADPTATIIGTFYDLLPRNGRYNNEKGLGLVSNFPLSYQEKVCNALAEEFRGRYYPCALDKKARQFPDNTTNHPMNVPDPRAVIRHFVQDVMTRWLDVAELTAYYTGFTRTAFENNNWTWTPDEKGRVFVDILTDYILTRWNKGVEKHRQDIVRYNNPNWGFDDPFFDMSFEIKSLIQDTRLRNIEKRRLCRTMRTTFLYGCASQQSGATNLPLIGARYAYGPIRKQIAQYVGAVDA